MKKEIKPGRPGPGKQSAANEPVSLKQLAEHLSLNPATVSVVLNNVPGRSIPEPTRERIKAAAQKLGYQPNLLARSLRNRRTHTIGILVPELGDGYHTQVMSGIGDYLMDKGYFYFTVHHRHRKDLVEEYSQMLLSRGAEALIAIDTLLEHPFPVPVVAVAGHRSIEGVSNVVLDHDRAAELAITHLYSLGHRRLAFMRGQPFSSDSDDRWRSIVQVTRKLGLQVRPELVVQLDRDITTPDLGYPVVRQLLCGKKPFTALVAFNDIAAIGAMRALQDVGLRVPDDVSVIGFDDIKAAAFNTPSLTTIHQPLSEMGKIAAQCALGRLQGTEKFRARIPVHPELTVRESTSAIAFTADPSISNSKRKKSVPSGRAANKKRKAALDEG